VPWAGAKIWQSAGSGVISGAVVHTGRTQVSYDTHGFTTQGGGVLLIPFTGIYRVDSFMLFEPRALRNVSNQIFQAATSSFSGETRIAFFGTQTDGGHYIGSLSTAIKPFDQGTYIRFKSDGEVDYIVHGNASEEQNWGAITYLGLPGGP
jgi:hypothetical protein